MKKFKIISLILLVPLLLTGCFGSDEEEGEVTGGEVGKASYDHAAFSIEFPQDWELLEVNNFTSNVPTETIVGFRNNIKSDVFTANTAIAQTILEDDTTASDFATSSKTKASQSLLSFEELGTLEVEIGFEGSEIFGVTESFQGKKSASEPIIVFKQLFVVYEDIGYSVTTSHSTEEDETVVKYLDEMLNSFALK